MVVPSQQPEAPGGVAGEPERLGTSPGAGPAGVASLPPLEFARRVAALREAMARAGCDALLVTGLSNVRYLTGFSGSAGMVFLGPAGVVLVTDGRYLTSAKTEVARSGARVEAVAAAKQAELLGDLLSSLPAGKRRLGLEAEHISWATKDRWERGWAKSAELVPTSGLVERLRERKEEGELSRLATAAAIADAAFARVLAQLEAGQSEVEVATALEAEMRRLGAESPAFGSIVASGPSGAEPHHHPGDRRLVAGELLTVDFGARWEGYCSDATRTFTVGGGSPEPELARVLSVVRSSQEAGLGAVRAGVAAASVDRACREVIEAAGLGELFVHGTGHGVGLDIHEAPSLSSNSPDVLEAGQVVTVEPGVYVAGVGGARIEDTVVVTEDGCVPLTKAAKD